MLLLRLITDLAAAYEWLLSGGVSFSHGMLFMYPDEATSRPNVAAEYLTDYFGKYFVDYNCREYYDMMAPYCTVHGESCPKDSDWVGFLKHEQYPVHTSHIMGMPGYSEKEEVDYHQLMKEKFANT